MIGISTLADNPVHLAATASIARHDEIVSVAAPDDADELIEDDGAPADGCVKHGRTAAGEILHYPPPTTVPTTVPTPTPPTEAELRWALRRTLAGLDAAAGRARNARRALSEGTGMLSAVEAKLDAHRAAAHATAEAAGAALARALADGDVATLPAPAAPAVDTAAITLGQHRAEAAAAIEHLVSDLATASAAHEGASVAVGQARAAIINFEVADMTRRLLAMESTAAFLRRRLMVRSASAAPWPPVNTRIDASGPEFLSAIEFWKLYDEGLRKNPEFSLKNLLGENGI